MKHHLAAIVVLQSDDMAGHLCKIYLNSVTVKSQTAGGVLNAFLKTFILEKKIWKS